MARGIDRTELLELLAETVNNENPMLPGAETIKKHSPPTPNTPLSWRWLTSARTYNKIPIIHKQKAHII